MNKILKSLLVGVALMGSVCGYAEESNRLYFEDQNIDHSTAEQTISIPVYLQSAVDITSFQADLYVPNALTLLNVTVGEAASETHYVSKSEKEGYLRIVVSSMENAPFNTHNGVVANINLKIPAGTEGNYNMYLKDIYLSDLASPANQYHPADAVCKIDIVKVLVGFLSLDKTTAEMYVDDTMTLTPTIMPTNAENKTLTWTSSDNNIVTVANGVVTAKAVGTATVTASTTDGSNLSATCTITVSYNVREGDKFEVNGVMYEIATFGAQNTVKVARKAYTGDVVIAETVEYLSFAFGVTGFCSDAFQDAGSMKSLTLPWSAPKAVESSAFTGVEIGNMTLKVPAGALENYMNADVWKGFGIIDDGTLGLGITNSGASKAYDGTAILPEFKNLNNLTLNYDESLLSKDAGEFEKDLTINYTKGTQTGSVVLNFAYKITKVMLSVTVKDTMRVYSEANPEFEIGYEGFVNNETEDVLTRKAEATTEANEESKPGEYAITLSGAESKNYDFDYKNGVLTIVKKAQTLDWPEEIPILNKDGDYVVLRNLKASSGLRLTVTSSEEEAVKPLTLEAEGDRPIEYALTPIGIGSALITVTQDGGDCYEPVSASKWAIVLKENATSWMLGDANADERIDVADITTIAKYILYNDTKGFNIFAGDATKDGEINVADITTVAKMILEPGSVTLDGNKH